MENPDENETLQRTSRNDNIIRLVHGGKEYFELLESLIDGARFIIHLQVYIFTADKTGLRITDRLIQAAKRGVQVHFLVDGYASQNLPADLVNKMLDAGVYFNRFEPLFKSRNFYFGRRLHHKVAVFDSSEALVGGINISDRYNGLGENPPWMDLALYTKGVIVPDIEQVCCDVWNGCGATSRAFPRPAPLRAVGQPQNTPPVRLRINDWVKGKRQIKKSYTDLVGNAREDLIIACSYFLPGPSFRRNMIKAVKRGVNIRVIVAGASDVAIAKHAERFLYRWMLRHGVRIFEYQKSVLHAKTAVADGRRMTLGSYNINNISAYASIELNLDVRNQPFVSTVKGYLEQLIEHDCMEVTAAQFEESYNWFQRVWHRCCYGIIKVLMYLFTFYFRQDKPVTSPRSDVPKP